MYGNLEEIGVGDILQLIESGQKSGVLFIETSSLSIEKNDIFVVFCCFGKIIYAADNNSFSLIRIYDFLYHYKLQSNLAKLSSELIASSHIPEYESILLLGQKQVISNNQAKTILKNIIEEIIFQLLLLPKGSFVWQENYQLQPQMIQLKIEEVLQKLCLQQQSWLQYYPHIQYCEQCPVIKDKDKLKTYLDTDTYDRFCELMDGKKSLVQLSRYWHQDLLTFTADVFPYLEKGWITLLDNSNQDKFTQEKPRTIKYIIYLTKDKHWSSSLSVFLKNKDYQLLVVSDLSQAFQMIFELNPHLILLEMDEFNFNSDRFCQMIRNDKKLAKTPIIVITNYYKFINNLKHKIVGATEYITKSVFTKDLLKIIEKHI